MVLNVIFLAGGIGVGYLIRGELDRRKSKKAFNVAMEEILKISKNLVETLGTKEETDDGIDADPVEISLDNIKNMFNEATDSSNSTDETIQL